MMSVFGIKTPLGSKARGAIWNTAATNNSYVYRFIALSNPSVNFNNLFWLPIKAMGKV